MGIEIRGELVLLKPRRTDSGNFVTIELPSPEELEPFFLANKKRMAFMMVEIQDEQEQAHKAEPIKPKDQGDKPSVFLFKLCREDMEFRKYWGLNTEDEAADFVKGTLQIQSRKSADYLPASAWSRFLKDFVQVTKNSGG